MKQKDKGDTTSGFGALNPTTFSANILVYLRYSSSYDRHLTVDQFDNKSFTGRIDKSGTTSYSEIYYLWEFTISGNNISYNIYDGDTLKYTGSFSITTQNIINMQNKVWGFCCGYGDNKYAYIKDIFVETL